jgi:hypothetical protein
MLVIEDTVCQKVPYGPASQICSISRVNNEPITANCWNQANRNIVYCVGPKVDWHGVLLRYSQRYSKLNRIEPTKVVQRPVQDVQPGIASKIEHSIQVVLVRYVR